MCSDIAIRVDDVCKHYLTYERPEDRLRQMILPKIQRGLGLPVRQHYKVFEAVQGVSLTVGRGETVGIVGRNGSGKSTLLQMICGTLQPTTGNISVNGRIAALLELGAGFNPEFTGRENVFLNAAILGLTRGETEARFADIVRFADIGDFINQPVKTYSSGMYVRLAFAVAINVDPDILIVDEALAVGDEAFQRKCFARIEDIKNGGGTILFVSHAAQSVVQLCDRAILLDRGEKILDGNPKTVISQYQRFVNLPTEQAEPVRDEIRAMDGWAGPSRSASAPVAPAAADPAPAPASPPEDGDSDGDYDPSIISHSRVEYENRGATIDNIRITTPAGRQVNVLHAGQRYVYEYTVHFDREVRNVGFGMLVKTIQGMELGGATTGFSDRLRLPLAQAGSVHRVRFALQWSLTPGTYFLNAGVTGSVGDDFSYSHRILDAMSFRIAPTEEIIATSHVDFGPEPLVEEITEVPA
jgi:lipopolysaccharide transport system ATP-binding protein